MSNLANILAPAGSSLPLPNSHAAEFSRPGGGDRDFHKVMSEAMNPRQSAQNQAASPRSRSPLPISSPTQPKADADPGSGDTDTPSVTAKSADTDSSRPTGKTEATDKDPKSADASPAAVDPEYSAQNIPIQFLAPTLTALLLRPSYASAPTTGGATTTPLNLTDWTSATGKELAQPGASSQGTAAGSTAKTGASETTSATDAGKKIAAALKDLGLEPVASAQATPAKTAADADKIAGPNLTAAKNDLPAKDGGNDENKGVSAKTGSQAALISSGTAVAKDEVPMKKAENTNQTTGQAEKVLPGQSLSAARVSNSLRADSASATTNDLPTATNIIPLSSAMDRNANATSNSDAVAVANLSDIQARAMERTHDMVTNNALRLVSTQSDTMQVVLKPGAGTELSLELRQRGGVIEAQAVLQHGDYQNLSQHWPDLQQRLEQKGIKLAALTSDESSLPFNGSQGNPKNQESSEHEALFASAFAEFSLAGVMHAATATPMANMVRNGFETWA
jgi:hypothetical protein